MKRLLFRTTIALSTLFLLASCTQDVENENFNSSMTRNQELIDDLTSLSNNLQSLYVDAIHSGVTRSGIQFSQLNEQAIGEMEEKIRLFQQKYDICQDLDNQAMIKIAKMMSLSEDSVTLLMLDDDAYFDYIHDMVSEDFYDIQCHFRRTGCIDLTEQEIINNNGLRLNEKLQLLILIPFINHAQSLHNNTVMTRGASSSPKTVSKEKTKQQHLEEAKAQWDECIKGCLKNLAKNVLGTLFATSITEGMIKSLGIDLAQGFTAYGLIESAYENDNCMNECDKTYQEAIK